MFETEYRQLVEKLAPSEALVSDTLSKMQKLGQSKKPIRRVRGTMILAAVLLLSVIGASAITLGSIKVFNWKGEDVTEEKLPDYNTSMESTAGEKLAWQLLGQAPTNEYWAINYDKDYWLCNKPRETITSLEEYESRIASSSLRFPIPRDIPEGYRFESASFTFRLTEKTIADGFAFLKKEVMDDGVTVYKYRVPDSVKENVDSYDIRFQKDEEQSLHIWCNFGQLQGERYFYVNEEESTCDPVAVKGMLDGMYIEKDNYKRLYLRTMYLPNEKFISWPSGEIPGEVFEIPYGIFNTLDFTIDSNTLGKDQLLEVAQGLR